MSLLSSDVSSAPSATTPPIAVLAFIKAHVLEASRAALCHADCHAERCFAREVDRLFDEGQTYVVERICAVSQDREGATLRSGQLGGAAECVRARRLAE